MSSERNRHYPPEVDLTHVEESARRKMEAFIKRSPRTEQPAHHEALDAERVAYLLDHHTQTVFRLNLPSGGGLKQQVERVGRGRYFATCIGTPETELRLHVYERRRDGFWRYEFRLVIVAERPPQAERIANPRTLGDDDPLLTRYRWTVDEGPRGAAPSRRRR